MLALFLISSNNIEESICRNLAIFSIITLLFVNIMVSSLMLYLKAWLRMASFFSLIPSISSTSKTLLMIVSPRFSLPMSTSELIMGIS